MLQVYNWSKGAELSRKSTGSCALRARRSPPKQRGGVRAVCSKPAKHALSRVGILLIYSISGIVGGLYKPDLDEGCA